MSIAAIGNCGRIIGTASYFDQIRCNIFLRNIPFHRDCEFWNTARLLAERADNSISNVYDDLSRINHAISSMSDTNRDNLIKQIRSLDDVCRLGGVMCGRSGTCTSMLESISRAVRFSFFTERIRRKYSENQKQLGVLGGRGYCNDGKSIRMGYQLGGGWK